MSVRSFANDAARVAKFDDINLTNQNALMLEILRRVEGLESAGRASR